MMHCVCPTRVVYVWTHTHNTLRFCDVGLGAAGHFFQTGLLLPRVFITRGDSAQGLQLCGKSPAALWVSTMPSSTAHQAPPLCSRETGGEEGARGGTAVDEPPRRENHVHRGERSQHRECAIEISWHTTHGFLSQNPQTPTHPIHPKENKNAPVDKLTSADCY